MAAASCHSDLEAQENKRLSLYFFPSFIFSRGYYSADFISLGSKITADGDGSHEIKTRLLLGRKAMTNLDSILQSRDITLPTKVTILTTGFSSSSCTDVRVGP